MQIKPGTTSAHITEISCHGLRKISFIEQQSLNAEKAKEFTYTFGAVNLFIGPNGGGKSTLVDIVRSLSDASVLKTLGRDNPRITTPSQFKVKFQNHHWLQVALNKTGVYEVGFTALAWLTSFSLRATGKMATTPDASTPAALGQLLDLLGTNVCFRNTHDEVGVDNNRWLAQLSRHATTLNGIGEHPVAQAQFVIKGPPGDVKKLIDPFVWGANGYISVALNDDESMRNNVHPSAMPSGWRAFGGLLGWLAEVPEGSVCVIEEPETHLHPTLQRILVREILSVSEIRKLQIFMTTHSATMIDYAANHGRMQLFQANGWTIQPISDPVSAVGLLGLRPSDLCLTSGIVWVEGPSDRLYLLHWMQLWCEASGRDLPVENIDYSFAFYGGSLLNHYTAVSTESLIDILGINPNSFILMDADLDFISTTHGQETPHDSSSTKTRIIKEVRSHGSPARRVWVTDGYTIESGTPAAFLTKHYKLAKGRLVKISTRSKVQIAHSFRAEHASFDTSKGSPWVEDIIQSLFDTISYWSDRPV